MFKSKTSKFFIWIIVLLLFVGLAGFSVGGFGTSFGTIATVGNKKVYGDTYARELNNEIRAFARQNGRPIPFPEAQDQGIPLRVQQRLIAIRALDNEASNLGISVGDDLVRQQILGLREFNDQNGDFDREAYRQSLRQNGQRESEFELEVRENATRDLIRVAIASGAKPADTYVDTFYNFLAERRNFTWVSLTAADLETAVGVPSADQLQTYYDENPAPFTLPETKRITYAWLTPDMLRDQIDINEDDLRKIYNDNIDDYVIPERRLVERLVFGTQAEADAAKARLDAGEITFPDLVAERELTLAAIDLGDQSQESLGEAGDAVFGIENPGGVVGPLPSPLGPALYRMNAILSAQETTFEEVREQLESELAVDDARGIIEDQINPLEDRLASGATLETLAEDSDLQVGTIDWYPGVTGDIANYISFRIAAAGLTDSDFPEFQQLEDGGIFAMRLDEVIAPRVQPLEDVRAAAIQSWQAAETMSQLEALAANVVEQMQNGEDIAALGLTERVEQDITREQSLPEAPVTLITEVFQDMAQGDVRSVTGAETVAVVRLDDILPPDHDNPEIAGIRGAIINAAEQSLAEDLLLAYIIRVQQDASPTINQAAVNTIHANFQ
ncbi:peptidylprolyl isomerase [Parasulfitobacter algicola]|uniref:SurA N-terminal domain-containing protein n=1 Tax=Parasulfitobacter algicola TaxID=2614809 RepID=A0ABX2IRZ6_9RHOB|nr:peptidylprolyl isomerase [Sulfitobacter algicola]NSX55679.1 SurA N-terminal domain-containing protein [Sulfitobacter algicola]